jgi:hypothetical protein
MNASAIFAFFRPSRTDLRPTERLLERLPLARLLATFPIIVNG